MKGARMSVKYFVLLGLVGVAGAMEPVFKADVVLQMEVVGPETGTDILRQRKPIHKLVRSKKMRRIRKAKSNDVQPVDPNSLFAEYMIDAKALISHISFFERSYPEREVSKTLKYYSETYPTSYDLFFTRVRNLKLQMNHAEDDEEKIIIDFLQTMHEFRYENAHDHKEAKEELVVAKEGLEGEKSQLQQLNANQQEKTKYANWRAMSIAAGGMVVTIVTGLASWFARPNVAAATTTVINATARLLG